jgi:hypothetical protein
MLLCKIINLFVTVNTGKQVREGGERELEIGERESKHRAYQLEVFSYILIDK